MALAFKSAFRPLFPDPGCRLGGLPGAEAFVSLAWLLWGGEGLVNKFFDLEEPGEICGPLPGQLRRGVLLVLDDRFLTAPYPPW